MSPEQALAKHGLVDHRTDVYSLGATLYELLTLRLAVDGQDREEILWKITFEEPTPPRRLTRTIPPELETILLKAMEKNPDERYATAKELADDLHRFLEDRPIVAKRPNFVQRLVKWSKRHQAVMVTTCLFLLLAVIGLALGSVLIWQQKTETGKALAQAEEQERLASANAARASAQRERAESNLDWSLNVTRDVLVKLDGEDLSELPAIPEVRRRLTAHAVRLLQEQVDERSADPAVRQDTARIYGAIAHLHSGQDDHEAARAAFEKASAILETLTIDCPDDPRIWIGWGHTHVYLGNELESLGLLPRAAKARYRAAEAFSQAIRVDPDDANTYENLAYLLVTCREPSFRDPARAVALASRAVQLGPAKWFCWNTLGMAHYRAGDWKGAALALEKSMELRKGGDSNDWFFQAMACWRLGEKDKARKWFDRAIRWADENQPRGEDFRRLRVEAAALLQIKDPPVPRKEESPRKK